jgi:hypothetical protein
MAKKSRKKITTINFKRVPAPEPIAELSGDTRPSTSGFTFGRVLTEKTKVRQDGTFHQTRSFVPVHEEQPTPRLRPDLRREPIYESFTAGDHGDGQEPDEVDEDEGVRDLRESVSLLHAQF